MVLLNFIEGRDCLCKDCRENDMERFHFCTIYIYNGLTGFCWIDTLMVVHAKLQIQVYRDIYIF